MALVVLAMSGGVDSSVAAQLLQAAGHEVIGVFLRHGEASPAKCDLGALPVLQVAAGSPHKQGCCTASDAEDARRIADQLHIPFYALDMQQEFGRIMDYFVADYSAGRTPNPCVMCNQWIKFGKLFEFADTLGAQFLATGHYARLTAECNGTVALRRGTDADKDQAYVLFGIIADRLPRLLLPVGDYRKSRIREMARDLGFRVADKKDSQEICFVTSGHHADWVAARKHRTTAGNIVTVRGDIVGQHHGIEGFTIGQRKGLGVALGEPYFVVEIDPSDNRVIVGHKEDLAQSELTANDANWLVPIGREARACQAQIRYNSRPVPATLWTLAGNRFRLRFEEPCHGVAPGQAVVCFDGDRVLGGGWIESPTRENRVSRHFPSGKSTIAGLLLLTLVCGVVGACLRQMTLAVREGTSAKALFVLCTLCAPVLLVTVVGVVRDLVHWRSTRARGG